MAESIIVLRPSHFFGIDNDLIDVHAQTIGALGVAVYVTLARYANRKTGECWPAIRRIERLLGLARSTVKEYLRKLEAAGLITIAARRDAAGDPTSHLYTLLDPSPASIEMRRLAREACPPVASQPTGGSPADPEPSHLNTEEKNQGKNQDVRSSAEESPKTPSSTALPPALPDRPDDFLSRLDVSTLSRLETEARAILGAGGIPQCFIISPVLHSAMATLWCRQHGPLDQAGADSGGGLALQEEDGTVSRAA